MNKGKIRLTLFTGCLLWILSVVLSGILSGHDPTTYYPGPATQNYHHSFIVFPHFAVGTSGNINYTSVLQITNTDRERRERARLTIHGTGSTRFEAEYTINGLIRTGSRIFNVDLPPLGTTVLVFRSHGPVKSGFINLSPNSGAVRSDFATSFFFQIRDVHPDAQMGELTNPLGELTDSVGVAPSDFGWHFVIPVAVSSSEDVNTGIAYSHIPVTQRVQVVFELRHHTGVPLAIEDNFLTWADNVFVEPYHKAQYVTDMFPDLFEGHEHWTRTFYGSLHIYAQRNINVLALRIDTSYDDGNIQLQLTSVPSSGDLCIDGWNRADNCFEEELDLTLGWVPVRKKSANEIWSDEGGFCDEAGVCSP